MLAVDVDRWRARPGTRVTERLPNPLFGKGAALFLVEPLPAGEPGTA